LHAGVRGSIPLASIDHVAPVVGSWWGPTTKAGRAQNRFSEEIDVVGIGRSRAAVIGECKWTGKPLSV
jgi:hypothetical protein